MMYKGVHIDTSCLYMPEIKTPQSLQYLTGKTPCVAYLPDIERGFESIEDAKKFIDKNIKRLNKEAKEQAKKYNIPF